MGGLLVDAFGWQAIFGLGVVLGLPTTVLARAPGARVARPGSRADRLARRGDAVARALPVVFAVLRGNALGWTSATVLGLVALGRPSPSRRSRSSSCAWPTPMLDLRLFRNSTFLGATVIVATLAGGSFGVFVYLSLFLLDVAAGARSRSACGLRRSRSFAFACSLLAGRLAGRVPLTAALALGMGLYRGRPVLMTGVDADSSWLHLLAGLSWSARYRAREPAGDLRPPRRAAARPGRARIGINNTARQLGLAVGIAVLGVVLQTASPTASSSAPTASARPAARSRTGSPTAMSPAPPGSRRRPRATACAATYEAAFASGLNELLFLSAGLALVGLAAALVLVRSRDLWQPAGPGHERPRFGVSSPPCARPSPSARALLVDRGASRARARRRPTTPASRSPVAATR